MKIFKLIIIIILFKALLFADCVCFYLKNSCNVGYNNCLYFKQLMNNFNADCKIDFLNKDILNKNYDIIMISGFGNLNGMFINNDCVFNKFNDNNTLKWSDIAKINANFLIVDACYSGFIFDYKYKAKNILTSTNKSLSVNYCEDKNIYGCVGSMQVALRCLYDDKFNCPINKNFCKNVGLSLCQFNIIIKSIKNWNTNFNLYKWEYPEISSCLLNGEFVK